MCEDFILSQTPRNIPRRLAVGVLCGRIGAHRHQQLRAFSITFRHSEMQWRIPDLICLNNRRAAPVQVLDAAQPSTERSTVNGHPPERISHIDPRISFQQRLQTRQTSCTRRLVYGRAVALVNKLSIGAVHDKYLNYRIVTAHTCEMQWTPTGLLQGIDGSAQPQQRSHALHVPFKCCPVKRRVLVLWTRQIDRVCVVFVVFLQALNVILAGCIVPWKSVACTLITQRRRPHFEDCARADAHTSLKRHSNANLCKILTTRVKLAIPHDRVLKIHSRSKARHTRPRKRTIKPRMFDCDTGSLQKSHVLCVD
eukprot:Opistho-2@7653